MYELHETPHTAPAGRPTRRPRTPTLDQLKWAKTALEVFILILAVPWLLHELVHDPTGLSKKIAGNHMKAKP